MCQPWLSVAVGRQQWTHVCCQMARTGTLAGRLQCAEPEKSIFNQWVGCADLFPSPAPDFLNLIKWLSVLSGSLGKILGKFF